MNTVLWNDLEFEKYVDFIFESEDLSEEQKELMLTAKVENAMQSKKTIENVLFSCDLRIKRNELLKDKINQISQWVKAEEKKIERIECGIKQYMEMKNIDEIDTEIYKLKLKKNPPKLIITDESKIPSEYQVVETIIKFKNDEIKKELKEGKQFEWAHLEQTKRLDY